MVLDDWSTGKKVAAVVAVCCVGLIIVGMLGGGTTSDKNTSTSISSDDSNSSNSSDNSSSNKTKTDKASSDDSDSDNSDKVYTDGTYKVGTDLPAGEYKFTQTSPVGGYVERSKDSSMEVDSIISNEATTSQGSSVYVTVKKGEYLKIQGGDLTPA